MVFGKSILTCILSKEFSKISKKTLVIDFDIDNKSISVLYNKYLKEVDYNQIRNNIIKVSKYEDILTVEKEFFSSDRIFELINEFKEEYEQILIDTSGNMQSKCYERILALSDDIVFIIVPTICDIKKSINMYEILINDFCIPDQKIKIVINKENSYSVDNLIIQKMFGVSKINGKIRYNEEIVNSINGKLKRKIKIDI